MEALGTLEALPAPSEVTAALARHRDALRDAAKDNLHSLVLYGGLARGRYRPGRSDVNVIVVLRRDSLDCLRAIGPILRDAWREIRLEPFILTLADVPRAAQSFPTKMTDIIRSHVVLLGEDPFAGITIDPGDVARRVEQELRNLSLRLRRRFVAAGDDARVLREALEDAAVTLRVDFNAMLDLAGEPPPDDDTSAVVFPLAARKFGLDPAPLAQLAALRTGSGNDINLQALLAEVIALTSRAADLTGGMGAP
jgi:hypothetical protein